MRRRRAQRCLLRAEVALEAGFIDDARTALDEARRLEAPAEEIARIEGLIAAAADAPVPPWDEMVIADEEAASEPDAPRLGWKPLAAAALILLAASIFGAGALWRDTPETVPTAETAVAAPEPPPNATVQNVPVRVDNVLAVPTTGVVSEDEAAGAGEAPVASDAPADEPAAVEDAPTTAADVPPPPRVTAPQPQALSAASTLPVPRPTLAPPPVVIPSPQSAGRDTTASATPAARILPTVDPVPALTATAPPPRDESADVRAVLARYENAYTQLNPSAARAVWPDVDERALARAFSSLASQEVSLGRCDVAVNGSTARATCVGTATWTPKVGGGGSRTQARRWTFDLRKAGEAWQIERATAR